MRVQAGGGDAHENIVVHEVPLDGAAQWLNQRASEGALVDPKVYAGLFLCQTVRCPTGTAVRRLTDKLRLKSCFKTGGNAPRLIESAGDQAPG